MEWDSSTAFTTRTAYDWPSKNFCTPATIAAAAERWPPPVSDEMIRILGMRCDIEKNSSLVFGLWSLVFGLWSSIYDSRFTIHDSRSYRHALCFRPQPIHFFPRLLHFLFQLLDLDQVAGIERQRRIIAV